MFKGNFSLRHQPVTSSFLAEEEQVSERQRKGLPWVPLTTSALTGLRKSLLPAQGLCPPWGAENWEHLGVTDIGSPHKGQAV